MNAIKITNLIMSESYMIYSLNLPRFAWVPNAQFTRSVSIHSHVWFMNITLFASSLKIWNTTEKINYIIFHKCKLLLLGRNEILFIILKISNLSRRNFFVLCGITFLVISSGLSSSCLIFKLCEKHNSTSHKPILEQHLFFLLMGNLGSSLPWQVFSNKKTNGTGL